MATVVIALGLFLRNCHVCVPTGDLGRGRFAVVRRCVERATSHRFVAKQVRVVGGGQTRAEVHAEGEILRSIRHPNIINFHEMFETRRSVILILELVDGPDILTWAAEVFTKGGRQLSSQRSTAASSRMVSRSASVKSSAFSSGQTTTVPNRNAETILVHCTKQV